MSANANVGGQAVLEGVMMRSPGSWAVTVRRPDGGLARVSRPVFLAGGLTPDNAVEAIRTVQPWGLDVCSGVRTNGRLDAEKLAQLFAAVRSLPPGTLAGSDRAVRLR